MRVRRRRLSGDDRGAAMAEAAFVTPVLLLLVFGIFEFGLLMRDNLTLANTTRVGARSAATLGNEPTADHGILRAIRHASKALPVRQIDRIVVFNAGGPNGTPTASCMAGTPSSTPGAQCNVYTVDDLDLPASDFGCLPTRDLDRYFCPVDRKVAQSAANGGPPDYVGIWIQATHGWVTGLWGDALTITDLSVTRLEPQSA